MKENSDNRFQSGDAKVLMTGNSCSSRLSHRPPSSRARSNPRDVETAPAPITVELQINGRPHVLKAGPRTTLLDALREHLALTGSKKRLRPWPMRRLHGAGSTDAASTLA